MSYIQGPNSPNGRLHVDISPLVLLKDNVHVYKSENRKKIWIDSHILTPTLLYKVETWGASLHRHIAKESGEFFNLNDCLQIKEQSLREHDTIQTEMKATKISEGRTISMSDLYPTDLGATNAKVLKVGTCVIKIVVNRDTNCLFHTWTWPKWTRIVWSKLI